jgi:hypothetical protein
MTAFHQYQQCHGPSLSALVLLEAALVLAYGNKRMNEPSLSPSPTAKRMRRYRKRRREQRRCLMIEMPEAQINALVHIKALKAEMRNNANAIVAALHSFLDGTLGQWCK